MSRFKTTKHQFEAEAATRTNPGSQCLALTAIVYFLRRKLNSATPLVPSNAQIEGSGTGWKTSPSGPDNPEAKVLHVLPGLNS
jgi:hypothetical protein